MATPDPRPGFPIPEPRPRSGLRARIWVGCLGGLVVCAAGLALAIAAPPGLERADPHDLTLRIALALGAGLLAGLGLAAWLDHGIVGRLRAMASDLHAVPARGSNGGWGELSDFANLLQGLIARQRQLARAADELHQVQHRLVLVVEAAERWIATERWEELPAGEGAVRDVVEALNRGFARQGDVIEQNRHTARQVQAELLGSIEDARGAAEQAEHGFVEATALLTTVHELQRLVTELQQSAASTPAGGADPAARAYAEWRTAAAGAIEELVSASTESVEHLGAGLDRVQEIGDRVQTLSNRAILLALNVVLAGGTADAPAAPEANTTELKQLAREVRGATDRVAELSRQVADDVRAATDRMRGIRERVAQRLEHAPALPPPAALGPSADTLRLLSRVREMVQDAAAKGERLSQAGESASRAAQDLVRRLEEEASDLEGLVVRLSPTGDAGAPQGEPEPRSGNNLRLLGAEPPAEGAARNDREGRS